MQTPETCCAVRLLRIRLLRIRLLRIRLLSVAALYWFDCVVPKLPSAILEVIMQSGKFFSCRPAL